MRKLLSITLLSALAIFCAKAQTAEEAISYYLPKTAIHINLLIEKTTYEPGQFAPYAGKYMKLDNVQLAPSTTYRIIKTDMYAVAEPDSAKQFKLSLDKKHHVVKAVRSDNGLLLAINADAKSAKPLPTFTPSPQKAPLNPKDYMSQDIISATSTAKMAELTANEIYDIRDSRTQLSRGEADFMPKDGAQLRIMMNELDTQEKALLQVFAGTTRKDTTLATLYFVPRNETERELLFRFSKYFGLVDADDLSGTPYYIGIAKTKAVDNDADPGAEKKDKNDIGLRVNIPAKMEATIFAANKSQLARKVFTAPQFGKVEALSGELFGKKQSSKLILDPLNGSILSIEALPLEK